MHQRMNGTILTHDVTTGVYKMFSTFHLSMGNDIFSVHTSVFAALRIS
jgi:hypothetical protein